MNLAHLFPQLREAMRPATYRDGKTPKARVSNGGAKKTQKGATHIQGKHFLGRQILAMTPAFYRHNHRGVVKIVPNYLKPHPAPRGRNVWISA